MSNDVTPVKDEDGTSPLAREHARFLHWLRADCARGGQISVTSGATFTGGRRDHADIVYQTRDGRTWLAVLQEVPGEAAWQCSGAVGGGPA